MEKVDEKKTNPALELHDYVKIYEDLFQRYYRLSSV
jgi:hypothetical protein